MRYAFVSDWKVLMLKKWAQYFDFLLTKVKVYINESTYECLYGGY